MEETQGKVVSLNDESKLKTNASLNGPSFAEQWTYLQELPSEYRDSRFLAAYNVLCRYVDCSEATLYKRLENAEKGGDITSISFLFFKCAIVNTFKDRNKVFELQARASSAFHKDPDTFIRMVGLRTAFHGAFFPPGSMEELVPLLLEDRPEAAKMEYLVYIACLLVLDPLIPIQSLGVSRERLDEILKYCINIDIDKLDAELAYSISGME